MVLSDIINSFQHNPNTRRHRHVLRDNVVGISHSKMKQCTNLDISKSDYEEYIKILDKTLKNYSAEIHDLLQDSAKVTKYYNDTKDNHNAHLSKSLTQRLLVEILQDMPEYKNIHLINLFASKRMADVVHMFRHILMTYVSCLVKDMHDDEKSRKAVQEDVATCKIRISDLVAELIRQQDRLLELEAKMTDLNAEFTPSKRFTITYED